MKKALTAFALAASAVATPVLARDSAPQMTPRQSAVFTCQQLQREQNVTCHNLELAMIESLIVEFRQPRYQRRHTETFYHAFENRLQDILVTTGAIDYPRQVLPGQPANLLPRGKYKR